MKLKDIEEAIRNAKGSEALFSMLSQLLSVAEAKIGDPRFDAARMNQLAGYLAEIRYLLDLIGNDPVAAHVSWTAKAFAARYRDLEGKVKEIRNDCVGFVK